MNGGGKAEKENTPSEANLQEEEVRRGTGWGARGARAGGGWLYHGTRRPEGSRLSPRASACLPGLHKF